MKRQTGKTSFVIILTIVILSIPLLLSAQRGYNTLLPMKTINSMINEVSGKVPHNIMSEIAAFNRDRKAEEYLNTYWESEVMVKYAKEFGFTDVKIERFPLNLDIPQLPPQKQWDAEIGETYQVQKSTDMLQWEDVGGPLVADSELMAIADETWHSPQYYRVTIVTEEIFFVFTGRMYCACGLFLRFFSLKKKT